MLRLSRKPYRYSHICRSTDPLDSRVFTTIIKCGTFSISTRQYHGHRNGSIVYTRQPINTEHQSHTLGRNSLSRNFSNFGASRGEINSCSPHIRSLSTISLVFIDRQNEEHLIQATEGESLLCLAQRNELNIEGACGGTCACSTCHIIVESQDVFHKLPNPEDRECDMLDMAFGLTETSRLACQLKASNTFKGAKLRVPQYGNFTPSSMK